MQIPVKNAAYFLRCAQLLEITSNVKRLEVLHRLADGEESVTKLAHQIDLSQSALSQHLAKMRKAGVVETRRHGLTVYYRLAMPGLVGIVEEVMIFLKENSQKS